MRQLAAHLAEAYRQRDLLGCLLADTQATLLSSANLTLGCEYVLRLHRSRRAIEWQADAGPWLRAVLKNTAVADIHLPTLNLLVVAPLIRFSSLKLSIPSDCGLDAGRAKRGAAGRPSLRPRSTSEAGRCPQLEEGVDLAEMGARGADGGRLPGNPS